METCLKVLLLVGVVTAAPTPSSAPLPTHEDAILAAVQVYNQEPGTTLAYRLLEAEPQPDWESDLGNRFDVSSKTIQPVTFTVKETVCLVSEKRDPNQCEFKEDGLVKDCSGFFSTEQDPPSIIIKCEEVSEEPNVVTRGRWKRFWRGTGNFFRKHGLNILSTGLKIIG
ncbi:cathelicidin-2-like [Emys orbicularis]|uniref:cathelicidin-2-like n=1 Tax=Emys orbicularis TaxID=82168 RepID=UPI0031FC91A1